MFPILDWLTRRRVGAALRRASCIRYSRIPHPGPPSNGISSVETRSVFSRRTKNSVPDRWWRVSRDESNNKTRRTVLLHAYGYTYILYMCVCVCVCVICWPTHAWGRYTRLMRRLIYVAMLWNYTSGRPTAVCMLIACPIARDTPSLVMSLKKRFASFAFRDGDIRYNSG